MSEILALDTVNGYSSGMVEQAAPFYPISPDNFLPPNVSSPRVNMPYLTRTYALPIHNGPFGHGTDYSIAAGKSASFAVTGHRLPRPEDTLRRKTPNGTINAGYDGSSGQFQPQKHQLVPRNINASARSSHKMTFLQHSQLRNGIPCMWDLSAEHSDAPHTLNHEPRTCAPFQTIRDENFHPFRHHLGRTQYQGTTVPSVVQPSFPYVDPTALGGEGRGRYGPYWYDGTFVPYRPAAVRDPRFYHYPISQSASHLQYAVEQNAILGVPQQGAGPVHGPWSGTPSMHPSISVAGDRKETDRLKPGQLSNPSISEAAPPSHGAGIPYEQGTICDDTERRNGTFAWALQQYRDLLSFIHQTRRQHQSRTMAPPHHTSKVAFFPKPPSYTSALPLTPTELRQAYSDRPLPNAVGPLVEQINLDGLERPPTTAFRHGQPSSTDHDQVAYARSDEDFPSEQYGSSARGSEVWPSELQRHDGVSRTLRRAHNSVTASNSYDSMDHSPPARAVIALTSMTRMCEGSGWQWLEGMHLCGCLAYGLGRYEIALSWYQKVLQLEPKHLEAMSNLAATLLATGRKLEAEHLWSKVVKAAPNHFEAVEHLVGVFCNSQRTRDAIKVIEYVERCLRNPLDNEKFLSRQRGGRSTPASQSPSQSTSSDKITYDFDPEGDSFHTDWRDNPSSLEPGFGSSGFAIPGYDNGRMLALVHAKGNMLYGIGDNAGAARAFEDAVMIAAGRRFGGIQDLVKHILAVIIASLHQSTLHQQHSRLQASVEPILLTPEQALATAKLCFPYHGELPGLHHVMGGMQSIARRAVISTTSNSLLSLAKIYQDGMSNASRAIGIRPLTNGVRDILALYYLSLSLQPSPSTANNVGILLASVQQASDSTQQACARRTSDASCPNVEIPGVVPGTGVALALQYYNYGLRLDCRHAHLHTNLGSLLKDIGQLDAAIEMYERAVNCDGKFDIALANLANAVKDKGRISDAITFYRRAVEVSPDFAEAVCGLANALNSVCGWDGRGGIAADRGKRDRWHIDAKGMLLDARHPNVVSSGWIKRVIDIVDKQLIDGESWGRGLLNPTNVEPLLRSIYRVDGDCADINERTEGMRAAILSWAGQAWEGARLTRLIERATRRATWRWYRDVFVDKVHRHTAVYERPQLPPGLSVPSAPTVLPFHTFTCPMSAKQIRLISQRNGIRISVSTLRLPWLPRHVFPPPKPPSPALRVGYVSSDFNNHPLAHLMQSVFGLHDKSRVTAYCYATTASDNSVHRQQIQDEAPVFHDASGWSTERLVSQIVSDGIHVLVNLNGYTRGARNEVFAARPAPIQMSFMGFAGTLGAEWCDYLLADETAVPPNTLRPWRRNIDLEDQLVDETFGGSDERWVYGENIIYCRDTFFCCDHRQSAPDAKEERLDWEQERTRRWQMRKELFSHLADETIILANFNQLYKIDPTTYRTWLRILASVPNAVLWLLRFPDLGESHLLATARAWAGSEVASRIIFTDVAPKHLHISRARVCDLVLDTAECNAHTTAADVLWSGTPLLTLPRYDYKMCSRMAASILKGALPKGVQGERAAKELVAEDEDDYEKKAIALAQSLAYPTSQSNGDAGHGEGRLMELRRMLYESRWTSALFDTRRWVSDLEDAYSAAWQRWTTGQGGDIWLDQFPRTWSASTNA